MSNQTFSSITDGTNTFDVKDQNALPLSGGTMTGDIIMGSNNITGLSAPTEETDAATKAYVDSKISDVTGEVGLVSLDDFNTFKTTVLPLAGGTMSGDINMGSTNGISNLAEPTEDSDAATKNYVDTTSLPLTGGTMTGPVNMGNQSISNVAEPTENSDVATKSYVDDITKHISFVGYNIISDQTVLTIGTGLTEGFYAAFIRALMGSGVGNSYIVLLYIRTNGSGAPSIIGSPSGSPEALFESGTLTLTFPDGAWVASYLFKISS